MFDQRSYTALLDTCTSLSTSYVVANMTIGLIIASLLNVVSIIAVVIIADEPSPLWFRDAVCSTAHIAWSLPLFSSRVKTAATV